MAMAEPLSPAQSASGLAAEAQHLADRLQALSHQMTTALPAAAPATAGPPFVFELTIFVLAVFVGYYVVWRVTPALHSPLMSVTNAISSVIIVGALLTAGLEEIGFPRLIGAVAVTLAAVNIFGGFIVTQRMLQMFKKKR
jgi:NAD(P) transhydrogenase subunit alpha